MSNETEAKVISGTCGDNATYTLDEEGVLTISGQGKINKSLYYGGELRIYDVYKIVIEEGITELGEDCMSGFDSVDEVILPSTLISIGNYSLSKLTALKELTLPDNVISIGGRVFQWCDNLEAIYIPDSVTSIGVQTFSYCDKLSKVRLPKNMERIEEGLFESCASLTEITWPENLKSIGSRSFQGCNSLQNIVIPDTVEIVEDEAFSFCENLGELTFGTSIKTVGKGYAKKSLALHKIINNSSVHIKLNKSNEYIKWSVDGEKAETLPPHSTAESEGKKYTIKYELNKGKAKGKLKKKHEYGRVTQLPTLYRKGYTHIGWYVYQNKSWGIIYKNTIDAKAKGKIVAKAVFRKVKVSVENRKIKVSVTRPVDGKKGTTLKADDCYFVYSENPDMSEMSKSYTTAPYGKGLSKKLKKGKIYYVKVTMHIDFLQEDDEDYYDPAWGWFGTWKVKIK